MAVGLEQPQRLEPVKGIRLAATHCGIKKDNTVRDLTLIELVQGSHLAAVFTQSHFSAAPVQLCRQHLASTPASRYLLINSGNANAGTGAAGLRNAVDCCETVAAATGVSPEQVLPFSTGVIAEPLPVEPIKKAIPGLVERLGTDNWLAAVEGIMTTDTLPKAVSRQIEVDGKKITITGMAKGSGMIKPNMATMLSYIATDAEIAPGTLQAMLAQMVKGSFNSITVDGDTSTNDSTVLIATGAADVQVDLDHAPFCQALQQVFEQLAQAIIRDAEGATKFVEVRVEGAASESDARNLAFTIAESPLVKTALFASDPNWGRFIMAIGRAPLQTIDSDLVDLYLGPVRLLHRGLPDPDYREALGQAEMSREEILIRVNLNLGDATARVWTSDLSYEYVKINAEYRS
ncbi:MAG: bifunctional glutamate N-acetyltransferase/amino-acid acetyltransferase ArgJ [Gammaproteobacteria bacterium]|nr:MAG: bifunctional glutamate N-acetyltransferase/amino-acid acetyltransferase ArgJ [Gammaproteobacteria bacterium]